MDHTPNILMILTDDQGAWALHCAGNEEIYTPNLDRIAAKGIRFENFFCASPVCSPARASILTGRIPSQHGVHDWIRKGSLDREKLGEHKNCACFSEESKAVRYLEGMRTYTDMLADHGYQCALSGKWHLGDSMNPQHGFTRWYTIGRGGCDYFHPDVIEDGKLKMEDGYITDLITDHGLRFMKEMQQEEKPWYLSVHYTAPHSPWEEEQHPEQYRRLYRDCAFDSVPDLPPHPNQIDTCPRGTGQRRRELLTGYYAAITAMDAGVGRLLDELERQGELENTLVIFMADNGMNMGHHGIWGKGNGTFPMNLYDTSVKVPFLLSWPAQLPQGKVSSAMCSQYDFMQTLADLLGIEEEFPEQLPGKSFKNAITGTEEGGQIVVFDEYGPNRMIRTEKWKYIHRYPYGPDELYHLERDPDEMENLIDCREYDGIREELADRLNRWFARYADPCMDAAKEPVTGFGQIRKCGCYSGGKPVYEPYKK